MKETDISGFDLKKAEGYWVVTGYSGRSEEIIFPASHDGKPVKAIEDFTFYKNSKRVKRIIIPEGYTSIGEWTFRDCIDLTEIKLPESLTSIEDYSFLDCTGLTEIRLPENLTSIGDHAFEGCTGLTKIKLPKTLASIGYDAFKDCTGLAEISVDENNPLFCSFDGVLFDKAMTTLLLFPQGKKGSYSVPEGIVKIRHSAFDKCVGITGISFPQSLLLIDSYGFNSEKLEDITVNELNAEYNSVDGVLFDKETISLLEYPKSKDKTDYAVPDGTIYITVGAFSGCKCLINIVLPEGIKLIDNYAFAKCEGLKAITFPMSLQYIGEHVFEDCPNLETVTLSRKTRIGYKAFEGFNGRIVYLD